MALGSVLLPMNSEQRQQSTQYLCKCVRGEVIERRLSSFFCRCVATTFAGTEGGNKYKQIIVSVGGWKEDRGLTASWR